MTRGDALLQEQAKDQKQETIHNQKNAQQDSPSLEQLLDRVRKSRSAPLHCKGKAKYYQVDHDFEFTFDGKGRFELTLSGPFCRTSAYNGKQAWQVEGRAGIPYELELYLADSFRVAHAVWSGDWCEKSFGFKLGKPRKTDAGIELTIQSSRSTYTGKLVVDSKTLMPKSLAPIGWGSSNTFSYSKYKKGLARRIDMTDPAGNVDVLSIETVKPFEHRRDKPCGTRPAPTPKNFSFDLKTDAKLEVKKSRSGHLLVRPKINGEDVGWFMFDTGAPVTTINPSVAKKLGLAEIGQTFIGGAGSKTKSVPVRKAASLELGPVRLKNPVLTEFETIGRESVGIIGWDVLIHSIVEIDMKSATISIHQRKDYKLLNGTWHDMVLHLRHPHVQASFASDHKGLFRIDTGAGQLSVMFHSPVVERLSLLDDRETKPFQARGAGGKLELRIGSVEWFEIAGHRTKNPMALFCLDKTGALADGNTLGNIGGGVLTPFVLVFDYQGKRVGFVDRKANHQK